MKDINELVIMYQSNKIELHDYLMIAYLKFDLWPDRAMELVC